MKQKSGKIQLLNELVKDYKATKKVNYNVAGCVHPLKPGMTAKGYVPPGTTVYGAIEEACKLSGVRSSFMKRGVAQIGTRDLKNNITIWRPVSQKEWRTRKLSDGELLRFRLLPAGGGGGKNPLRTFLTVVVAIVAVAVSFMTQSWALTVPALTTKVAATGAVALNAAGGILVGMAGLAVSTIGMVLVNAIAPIKTSSLDMSNRNSSVYGLSAGQNAVNQWGRVPVPLGRGRFAPPKAASAYTMNKGDDQYLHELLCIGIGDLEISNIKIGTTDIEEFNDLEFEVFKYDPSLKNYSNLYPTGVFQEDLNVQLKKDVWNARTTAECDRAECDFSFQGLGYINSTGGIDERTVHFSLQYKLSDTEEWSDVTPPRQISGKKIVVKSIDQEHVEGVITIDPNNELQLYWNGDEVPEGHILLQKVAGEIFYIWPNDYYPEPKVKLSLREGSIDKTRISGLSINIHTASESILFDESDSSFEISGGYYYPTDAASMPVTFSGAQTQLLRKTFTILFPKRGVYDVRILRQTDDSTDDYERTDSYWTALRSISSDIPVQADYPVNLLAIKAKATGQLSGSLSNVTVFYKSRSLVWDKKNGIWKKDFSSNPASIFRHILQDKVALARPQSDSVIDLENLQEAYEYWDEKRWEWNFVCDSDASVFERLQSVCSAGLASPTMLDGKWGIIVDKERTHVACAFTSANSWGWSFERTQVRLPNEIHCNFISEETWDMNMQRVATDEAIEGSMLYETQTYEGVSKASQVYQLARFHYADAKNRRRTINLTCYDEALLCTRGDLVECACPNVSPQGLQVGRIRKVIKDENGYVTGFTTDQSNTTDFSGRRFGVRIYNSDGIVYHAEVLAENVTQQRLNFVSPQQMNIANGNKYAFGNYSEEVFQAIVTGMSFNSDWTCNVTLQDYVPSLYGDLSKPIPPFNTIITRPIESKWQLTSKPIIVDAVTDESVLVSNGTTLSPRIMLVVAHPIDLDERATAMEVDYKDSKTQTWINGGRNLSLDDLNVYISGVEEGVSYDVRIRYVSNIGFSGDYTYKNNIIVIGKTSLPPSVLNFSARIESPSGVRLSWSPSSVLDVVSYRISGDATTEVKGSSTLVTVLKKTGRLSFNIVAVDSGGRISLTPSTASVEVYPPKAPEEINAETRTDGLYLTWKDCDTTWPIRHYIITDEYLGTTSRELKTQYVVPPRSIGTYKIGVTAVDIFDNFSVEKEFSFSVEEPGKPEITAEINNGVVRLKWAAVSSSFPIKKYQIYSVDWKLLQETSSTFYDIDGPSGVLEYRIRAVDSAGNVSALGEITLQITAPEAPLVNVDLNKNRDGLDITWNVPNSMLPVVTYDIVRQWDEETGGVIETYEYDYGSTDSTALSVAAIPAGIHTFMVRAVDASGNRSVWGTTDLSIRSPGSALLTDVNVIDNNVQIYWQEPQSQFFAIAYYNFGTVDDGYFSLIGRIDARFASRFERKSGEYTYQICPVDVAGNTGQCSSITAQVAQPPDFVFYDDKDSTFNGVLDNCVLDGRGNMIMPVYPDETWQENINRVSSELSKDPSSLLWKDKINNGFTMWQSPPAPTATYTEIVDVGAVVPATSITVTVSSIPLEGTPVISCKIEVSENQESWREAADGSFSTYATSFRYVRYTFNVTNGMLAISNINYRLDVKKQSDFGSVFSNADDNGEGFISIKETPDLYGTFVPFSVAFTDIQSGPVTFCNEEGKSAYVNFQDVLKPKGFRVYVLDNNGQRVSGQVSWSAFGV